MAGNKVPSDMENKSIKQMFSLLYLLTCLALSTIFVINLELIATGLQQGKNLARPK